MDEFHNPMPHAASSRNTVNSVLAHVSQVGNSLLSLLSGLLAAALILYSSYVLYDTFYTQTTAGNSWDLLQYRPEIIDDGAVPFSGGDALAAINEDYRAWITLYDTNIDYPVMQGDDDLYYASHDIYGEPSLTGAIYLAAANSRGMTDSYNLIYGHHMDNGAMFGALDSYAATVYAQSHREGVLIAASGVYDLTVFAVASTDAYESQIYSVGNRAAEVRSLLEDAITGSGATQTLYYDAATAATADRIVALSTCAAADTNGRLVVFAKMTRRDLLTIQATGYGDIYDAQPQGLRDISVNYPEGTTFEYSIDGGQTWTTVPPTLTNVGTLIVTVRATNEIYGTTETTEVIQVNPAPVTVRALDATKPVGTDDPEFRAVVTGLLDDQVIIYVISRPGAGTDEEEGSYENAIIVTGEELQGNYIVTYIPGTMVITAEEIPENETPLTSFFEPFQPHETSGRAWALVNLICLLITIYIFVPLMHLKAKYGRLRAMKKVNGEKNELWDAAELDEQQRIEFSRILDMANAEKQKKIGKAAEEEITEKDFGNAVETLYYHVSKFTKRFWAGFGLEIIVVAAAIIAFVLTEDMRLPMVLIDRWTPLMIVLLLLCWSLDVWLMRYRDKILADEEQEKETAAATQ